MHYGRSYNNAFWSDSCFCMTFGDGDGVQFNPLVSLDVAGHEMSHGVTSRTANLTYSGESGGLNEATSDIFGTMVEFWADNALDTPRLQDRREDRPNAGDAKPLRFMYQPSLDGSSPDCYSSGIGSLDVHYSSGLAQPLLLPAGGGKRLCVRGADDLCATSAAADASGVSTLQGIGRDAAAEIWYDALTKYMTSSSDYAAARGATERGRTGAVRRGIRSDRDGRVAGPERDDVEASSPAGPLAAQATRRTPRSSCCGAVCVAAY